MSRTNRRRVRRRLARSLAVLAVAATTLSLASAQVAEASLPIPPGPGILIATQYEGSAADLPALPSNNVPQNPFLAAEGRNSMHNDSWATDAYPGPGPRGDRPKVSSGLYGVEECATIAFDDAGRIIGLCGNLLGPVLRLIDPNSLDVLASYTLPPRNLLSGKNPTTDLCGGTYFYLNNLGEVVVVTTERTVQVVGQNGNGFALARNYDLTGVVPASDCLIGLMPDYKGNIWFESGGGLVGTIQPGSGAIKATHLPEGEIIANSFAVDETGGVFIVSDHAFYRFDAAADGTPDVTWRESYDRGSTQKPGMLSQGSGTTPTIFGDQNLISITDNADPQMHVIAYDRSTGDKLCEVPVFTPGASTTENSLVSVGRSVIVENNYGYTGPQSTLLGRTTTPGIARVKLERNPDGSADCGLMWTSDEAAPTSVPKVSLATGLLYVYTKPKSSLGIDAWYFTGIDVRTGRTQFKQLTGTGVGYNNHYAAIYLSPSGVGYIATLAGLVRVQDR
jgi:hypothetical protein